MIGRRQLPDWVDHVHLDELCPDCAGSDCVYVEVEHYITRSGVRSIERGPYVHSHDGQERRSDS